MMIHLIITGVLLGFVSSFHCVGMCGPIAISLPVYYLPAGQKTIGIFLYNIGRISLYVFLGLLFGLLGRQVYLAGIQQWFSILLGVSVILFFIRSALTVGKQTPKWISGFIKSIQKFIVDRMKQKNAYAMFLLGAANGLLPCGMVYFALTGALAAGTVGGGMLFMTGFGLGTLPAMFALAYFGSLIDLSTRNLMKKAVPYFVLLIGILLIVRGLNLNIPYISPYLLPASGEAVSCH